MLRVDGGAGVMTGFAEKLTQSAAQHKSEGLVWLRDADGAIKRAAWPALAGPARRPAVADLKIGFRHAP